jgi:hypothetical protein
LAPTLSDNTPANEIEQRVADKEAAKHHAHLCMREKIVRRPTSAGS